MQNSKIVSIEDIHTDMEKCLEDLDASLLYQEGNVYEDGEEESTDYITGSYLCESKKYCLLTAEEERSLFKKLRKEIRRPKRL